MELKESILSAEMLKEYLRQKAKNHNYYKCYGPIDHIITIRDSKVLYLNNGEKWNDTNDKETFNNNSGKTNFGKCFSFSQDENVAMWMLYGGMDKCGGMIDFTKNAMAEILNVQKIEVGKFGDDGFKPCAELSVDKFQIYMTDIVYFKENKTGYSLQRSDEIAMLKDKSVFEGLGPCKKSHPWHYENECRLIICIDNRYIPNGCDNVKIDLSGLKMGKSFERIYKSPIYEGKEYENVLPSGLRGTIEWDLCKDCKERAACAAQKGETE